MKLFKNPINQRCYLCRLLVSEFLLHSVSLPITIKYFFSNGCENVYAVFLQFMNSEYLLSVKLLVCLTQSNADISLCKTYCHLTLQFLSFVSDWSVCLHLYLYKHWQALTPFFKDKARLFEKSPEQRRNFSLLYVLSMPMEACDKEMSSMKQNFLFLLLLFFISGGNKLVMLVLRPMKHVQSCKLSPLTLN